MAVIGDVLRALDDVPGIEAYFALHANRNVTLIRMIMALGDLQESGKLEGADPQTTAKQVLLDLGVHKDWFTAPAFVPPETILEFAIENRIGPFQQDRVALETILEWAKVHLTARQVLPEGYFYRYWQPGSYFPISELQKMLRKTRMGSVDYRDFQRHPEKRRRG
jgi:hypothetical protein